MLKVLEELKVIKGLIRDKVYKDKYVYKIFYVVSTSYDPQCTLEPLNR